MQERGLKGGVQKGRENTQNGGGGKLNLNIKL